MLLTVNKLNDNITGVVGNDKYTIPYSSEVHQQLLALENKFSNVETMEDAKVIITNAEGIISGISTEVQAEMYGDFLKFDPKSQKFFLHSNNVTSSIPLPNVLAEKVIEFKEKDLDFLPFVKAWMWFLKNPKFSVKKADYFAKYITTTFVDDEDRLKFIEEGYTNEKATEMATYNDVSITKNGLLSTYKYAQIKYHKFDPTSGDVVSRYTTTHDAETGEEQIALPENAEDFYLIPPIMGEGGDAYLCGPDMGHRIKVGAIHALASFDQINCQDGSFGGGGLHLGGRRYIVGYGGGDRLLLNAFVNPMHIGGFTDGGDGAMRVKEYFVHSAHFAPNKSFYNESTYLEHTNAQWADIRTEAIEASEAKIKGIKQLMDEVNAL